MFFPVIQRNREHSLRHFQRISQTVCSSSLQKRLRVGGSPKGGCAVLCQQSFSDIGMIIDLPVVSNHISAIPGYHGLSPGGRKIHNRQPPVSQHHPVIVRGPHPRRVRPAILHSIAHPLDIPAPIPFEVTKARNSTHMLLFPSSPLLFFDLSVLPVRNTLSDRLYGLILPCLP